MLLCMLRIPRKTCSLHIQAQGPPIYSYFTMLLHEMQMFIPYGVVDWLDMMGKRGLDESRGEFDPGSE